MFFTALYEVYLLCKEVQRSTVEQTTKFAVYAVALILLPVWYLFFWLLSFSNIIFYGFYGHLCPKMNKQSHMLKYDVDDDETPPLSQHFILTLFLFLSCLQIVIMQALSLWRLAILIVLFAIVNCLSKLDPNFDRLTKYIPISFGASVLKDACFSAVFLFLWQLNDFFILLPLIIYLVYSLAQWFAGNIDKETMIQPSYVTPHTVKRAKESFIEDVEEAGKIVLKLLRGNVSAELRCGLLGRKAQYVCVVTYDSDSYYTSGKKCEGQVLQWHENFNFPLSDKVEEEMLFQVYEQDVEDESFNIRNSHLVLSKRQNIRKWISNRRFEDNVYFDEGNNEAGEGLGNFLQVSILVELPPVFFNFSM